MSDGYKKFFKAAGDVRRSQDTQKSDTQIRKALNLRKKTRPPFPWGAVLGLALGLVVGVSYLILPEPFERMISRIEISALGAAQASEGKPKAQSEEKPAAKTEKNAGDKAATEADKGSVEKPIVQEDLSHFQKLQQRKTELDMREKELGELEEELQKQKVELDKRIQQLEEVRNQIAQILKDRVQMDQEKVNKLVDLYSNMKPKQAAEVIGSINEDLAVEVLAKMKKKNAAEVMNLLPPEKARVLSEKYTGYRRSQASEPNKG